MIEFLYVLVLSITKSNSNLFSSHQEKMNYVVKSKNDYEKLSIGKTESYIYLVYFLINNNGFYDSFDCMYH